MEVSCITIAFQNKLGFGSLITILFLPLVVGELFVHLLGFLTQAHVEIAPEIVREIQEYQLSLKAFSFLSCIDHLCALPILSGVFVEHEFYYSTLE